MSSPDPAGISPTQLPPSMVSISPTGGDGIPELKHSSIGLSLELERQLELEGSPPQTPTSASGSQLQQQETMVHESSLDPQVLAHIVAGLRKTIDDMTKERNDLLKLLDGATMREASLQDTLQLMTEKATGYEEELSEAKKKIKQDEEDITLLRHKVEESRRGLMRLQTESRRQSATPGTLDLSRANIPGFSAPPSSKRASFTPLTGRSSNGHRRVSSISVDGSLIPDLSPNPNGQAPSSFQDPGLAPPTSSRRSLFKYSPPTSDNVPLPSITLPASESLLSSTSPSPEVEALKKEVESLKKDLADTRMELAEANEGREAQELCVKALRGFIEENQVGENGGSGASRELAMLKLPPTPLGMGSEGGEESKKVATATSSGWGFKLWKGDATKAPVVNTALPPSSSGATSPSSVVTQPTPSASAPFSRLGGFFSSRSSSTTTASVPVANASATAAATSANTSPSSSLQTNAAIARPAFKRDSISGRSVSVSDASSVVEPLSPERENSINVIKVAIVPEDGGGGGESADGVAGVIEPAKKDDDRLAGATEAGRHHHQPATVVG